MNILVLNYAGPDLSRHMGGSGTMVQRRGPEDVADNPTRAECEAAEGIISAASVHGVGPASQYPKCRIIVRMGVGHDTLDSADWASRGVPVCNVPDYGTTEVADHAIALMLALARGIVRYHNRIMADPGPGGWPSADAPVVRRLRGARFGVIGLGRIGLAAALRARGFGMDISFYDPALPNGTELAVGAQRVHSVAALLESCDVVSLHAPLTPQTRHIIDAAALAAAKPGLVLVNTARGPLVDTVALLAALREGRVGAAGLDVLPTEPPGAADPLVQAAQSDRALEGRLILTPHAAYFSPDGVADLHRKSVEVITAYLRDGRLTNCVNAAELARARG